MNYDSIKDRYELLEEREIADLKSKGIRLKHKKSGARVMLLENDDRNKVFYIGFRTPPVDGTGTPHILEHSVLCGSRKFPVKDPFIELAKGSLNTFLNAMTYPDKTVYPVASTNKQDFYNLVDVYMDAVLHPNIYEHEEIFKQEGWHYEMDDPDGDIRINGVVYNEMKGAYSSPDDVLTREINVSLFPDTQYSKDSGGDPDHIPDLSYEKFKEMHEKYYHPSNSYIYLYGDLDMAEMLTFLDKEYLSDYTAEDTDSALIHQEPFKERVYVEKPYPITEDEEENENTYLSINYVISDNLNPETYIAFQILEYVLLSVPGAPLTQALLDKGIGHDVDGGYDNGILQPVFAITVKKSDLEKKELFLNTVRDVLKEQAESGIDKKALLSALNIFEFRYREADFGSYPKGLMYGLQSLDSWLYDDDKPFIHIECNDVFKRLKEKVNEGFFEELIKKYLLDNSFSSVVVLTPEKGLTAKKDKILSEKLARYKESLSKDEIQAIIDDTKALKEYQSTPSTEEELNTIPILKISDIEKKVREFKNEFTEENGIRYLFHDIYTNGIAYINFTFDLKKVPEEYLPYVSLYTTLLCQVDTERFSYADLTNEINLHSGGVDFSISTAKRVNEKGAFRPLFDARGRFLNEDHGFAFDIIPEILIKSKFDDKKRIKEVLSMMISRKSDSMVSAGHLTSAMRALSLFSPADSYMDKISGLYFYDFIKELNDDLDNRFDELQKKLNEARSFILRKDCLTVELTGSREVFDKLKPLSTDFASLLENSDVPDSEYRSINSKKTEGIRTASFVQYVAEAGNMYDSGLEYTGALRVLKVIMGYDYLWNNVRVLGGAYGCMSSFSRTGECYMVSYRDPHMKETLEIFNNAADFVKNFDASDRDMTKFIIGAVSNLDTPLTPKSEGARSRAALYSGLSYDEVQKERDQVLNCTQSDIRALAPFTECIKDSGYVCILGSEEKINENKDLFSDIRTLN